MTCPSTAALTFIDTDLSAYSADTAESCVVDRHILSILRLRRVHAPFLC